MSINLKLMEIKSTPGHELNRDGTIQIKPSRKQMIVIDERTQDHTDNVTAIVWGSGWSLNALMDHAGCITRSWPACKGEPSDRMFGSQLDPELSYMLIAVECPTISVIDPEDPS
jgi:hypothetical protein